MREKEKGGEKPSKGFESISMTDLDHPLKRSAGFCLFLKADPSWVLLEMALLPCPAPKRGIFTKEQS